MRLQALSAYVLGGMVTILLVAACNRTGPISTADPLLANLDLSPFALLPVMTEIDSGAVSLNLRPAPEYDYWELRGGPMVNDKVLAQGGSVTKDLLPPPLAAQITAIAPTEKGFGRECPPAWCFKYIVTVSSNKVGKVLDPGALRAFLGEIDTRDEATLLAEASGYHWGTSKEQAAIKEVADGYDLVVLRYLDTTTRCEHGGYRADLHRILLHISHSGVLTEQARQFLERGGCGIP